jgi:Domain of unknown function (DUF4157)/L,D-transpeptidase catalytic domain
MQAALQTGKERDHKGPGSRSAGPSPHAASAQHPILGLQQQAGNQAVQSLLRSAGIYPKLAISQPDDPLEREADQVADRVMRMADLRMTDLRMTDPRIASAAISPVLHRKCSGCEEEEQKLARQADGKPSATSNAAPPIVNEVLGSGGQPMDTSTRAFFEPRFGQDFGNVRIHTGSAAAESARAVSALAYTVGDHVVFGNGQYSPGTGNGQRLLAHELSHTVQQRGGNQSVMGTWDKADADCPASQDQKWIDQIIVNQEVPLSVTIHWSDGTTESDDCSTGKGHCCVDDKNPSGVACTVAQSQTVDSNCTPITQNRGYPVQNRVLDHDGINFWTEFVPSRAIALHEYSPVDKQTPLSHGCVRLHTNTAKKIFCNVRQGQTWVQVHGFARPKCSNKALQMEWLLDFFRGGQDLSKADSKQQGLIRETRKDLNAAFGRTLTPEEMNKFTAADIPRCSGTAPLPTPPAQQQPAPATGQPGDAGKT